MTGRSISFHRIKSSKTGSKSKVHDTERNDSDNESSSDVDFSGSFHNPVLAANSRRDRGNYADNDNERRFREEQMEVLKQLGAAVQKLSVAVDGNNAAIRELQQVVGEMNDAPPVTSSAPQRDVFVPQITSAAAGGGPAIAGLEGIIDVAGPVPDTISATSSSDVSNPDDGLDRKQVRLDGLEVYAVVSAVTAGTLVAVFDSYHPGDMVDLFHESRYLEVLMSIIFFITGSVGIVCGLHCIFVFSLVTMYGRTALGMERDDALEVFFAGTGLQRFHGFRTFVGSLYALMCELIVVITSKVSTRAWVHLTALAITARLMYYVYVDTQTIMEKAGVIFAPPPKPTSPPEEVEEDVQQESKHIAGDDSEDDTKATSTPQAKLTKKESAFNVCATQLIDDSAKDDDDGQTKDNFISTNDSSKRKRAGRRRSSCMSVGAEELIKDQEAEAAADRAWEAEKEKEKERENTETSLPVEDFSGVRLTLRGRGRTAGQMKKRISAMNFSAADLMMEDSSHHHHHHQETVEEDKVADTVVPKSTLPPTPPTDNIAKAEGEDEDEGSQDKLDPVVVNRIHDLIQKKEAEWQKKAWREAAMAAVASKRHGHSHHVSHGHKRVSAMNMSAVDLITSKDDPKKNARAPSA